MTKTLRERQEAENLREAIERGRDVKHTQYTHPHGAAVARIHEAVAENARLQARVEEAVAGWHSTQRILLSHVEALTEAEALAERRKKALEPLADYYNLSHDAFMKKYSKPSTSGQEITKWLQERARDARAAIEEEEK